VSALARRRALRESLLGAHAARLDRVRFCEGPVALRSRGALFRDGVLVEPVGLEVAAREIGADGVRLICLSGLGDALWTRGVVRETLKAGLRVWLETPYRWLFWDFEGLPGFAFYQEGEAPAGLPARVAAYLGSAWRPGDTVYGAMSAGCHVPRGDFRLALKEEWRAAADALLARIAPRQPVMLYRPLLRNARRRAVERRNPDAAAYAAIFAAIRERYHVISVAAAGVDEEIVHADAADTVFHHGELAPTTLAALCARAALVYTNPGMALVLAASLGVPLIGVFGGYEDAWNYSDTVVYGPALLLDPVKACRCMSDAHECDKRMDVGAAVERAREFCAGLQDRLG
jgi:hypothetical protein